MKNKLEKFLAGTASLCLMAAAVLGIRIKDDEKKLDKLEGSLDEYNASIADILATQKQIMANREAIMDKAAVAAAPDTFKSVTTKTVIPGKTVTQKVKSSSSNTTKSS